MRDRIQVSEVTQTNRHEQEESGDCEAVSPGGGAKDRTVGEESCQSPASSPQQQLKLIMSDD